MPNLKRIAPLMFTGVLLVFWLGGFLYITAFHHHGCGDCGEELCPLKASVLTSVGILGAACVALSPQRAKYEAACTPLLAPHAPVWSPIQLRAPPIH